MATHRDATTCPTHGGPSGQVARHKDHRVQAACTSHALAQRSPPSHAHSDKFTQLHSRTRWNKHDGSQQHTAAQKPPLPCALAAAASRHRFFSTTWTDPSSRECTLLPQPRCCGALRVNAGVRRHDGATTERHGNEARGGSEPTSSRAAKMARAEQGQRRPPGAIRGKHVWRLRAKTTQRSQHQ